MFCKINWHEFCLYKFVINYLKENYAKNASSHYSYWNYNFYSSAGIYLKGK